MVNAIGNVMKQIPTRQAECGATHRSSLGNGTAEQAHVDRAPKGRRSADPAQQCVVPRHARGRRGIQLDRLSWKWLEQMAGLDEYVEGQGPPVRQTRGRKAHAR